MDRKQMGPLAGDRAPDAGGLRRHGMGFALRQFDILRGTDHVLIAYIPKSGTAETIADLAAFARKIRPRFGNLRVVGITAGKSLVDHAGLALYVDTEGAFARAYEAAEAAFLVRPDGYLGWRGGSWRDAGLLGHLERVFEPARAMAS